MKLDALTAEIALMIFRKTEKNWDAYQETCEEERREGYRPSSCFHGRSLWVDYDCVCGICEDYGYYSFNRAAYRAEALSEAHAALKTVSDRTAAVVQMMTLGAPIQLGQYNDWISEPLTQLGYVPHYKR